MADFLLASLAIFAVLVGWVWVQQTYARFAARNPTLGPFRGEGDRCGSGGCSCSKGQCSNF